MAAFISSEASVEEVTAFFDQETEIEPENDSDRAFIDDEPQEDDGQLEALINARRADLGIGRVRSPSPEVVGRANMDIEAEPRQPPQRRRRLARRRNWVFTLNNPQDHGFPRFCPPMVWLRYGEEVAPTTGTPHLQGVVCFKNPVEKPSALYGWAGAAHWERMLGSIQTNLDYTGKDARESEGTLHEFGTRPLTNTEKRQKGGAATKERYMHIIKLAEDGDFEKIKTEYPGDYLRMFSTSKKVRLQKMMTSSRPHNDALNNWWIHGETGVGKSRSVRERIPESNLYTKLCNKWWDHYNGEDYVLIDDFEPDWSGKHSLKTWADHYRFPAEVKGSMIRIRPKGIIITSNYQIHEGCFRPGDINPIKRRFNECTVDEFNNLFTM